MQSNSQFFSEWKRLQAMTRGELWGNLHSKLLAEVVLNA